MPFGICNAPAIFERDGTGALWLALVIFLVYLDDILLPGRTFEEELANLCQAFQRLSEAKLKLPKEVCFVQTRGILPGAHCQYGCGSHEPG